MTVDNITFARIAQWAVNVSPTPARYEIETLAAIIAEAPEGRTYVDSRTVESMFRAMADGRKIEAIKDYRSVTGASLKEAKDAVEAVMGFPTP